MQPVFAPNVLSTEPQSVYSPISTNWPTVAVKTTALVCSYLHLKFKCRRGQGYCGHFAGFLAGVFTNGLVGVGELRCGCWRLGRGGAVQ